LVVRCAAGGICVARRSVEAGGERLALSGVQVAQVFRARIVVCAIGVSSAAVDKRSTGTLADDAHVILGANIAIITGESIEEQMAAGCVRIASVQRTRIVVSAIERLAGLARASLT